MPRLLWQPRLCESETAAVFINYLGRETGTRLGELIMFESFLVKKRKSIFLMLCISEVLMTCSHPPGNFANN